MYCLSVSLSRHGMSNKAALSCIPLVVVVVYFIPEGASSMAMAPPTAARPSTRGSGPMPGATLQGSNLAPPKDAIEEEAGVVPLETPAESKGGMDLDQRDSDVGSKRSQPSSSSKEEAVQPPGMEGGADDHGGVSGAGVAGAVPGGALFNPDEKRSMRPRTARQRPPKVKDNVHEVDSNETNINNKGLAKPKVVIMREGSEDKGDEVEEEEEDDQAFKPSTGTKVDMSGKSQHGKLVQDIMKEQKKVRTDTG